MSDPRQALLGFLLSTGSLRHDETPDSSPTCPTNRLQSPAYQNGRDWWASPCLAIPHEWRIVSPPWFLTSGTSPDIRQPTCLLGLSMPWPLDLTGQLLPSQSITSELLNPLFILSPFRLRKQYASNILGWTLYDDRNVKLYLIQLWFRIYSISW